MRLRLGVSMCLLGERVRWDGDHERRPLLADVLAPHVEWVPICPEIEIGLGVPREPIALVQRGGRRVLLGARSRRDWTGAMQAFAEARTGTLAGSDLDGYVLKSRSPSCGLTGARVYERPEDLFADGPFERAGRGLFAAELVRRLPRLPVVEESTLETRGGPEDFVERCFAMRRARALLLGPTTATDLRDFIERHELQTLCRSAEARRALAAAAGDSGADVEARALAVADRFAEALALPSTPARVLGVLRRVMNRLQGRLEPARLRGLDGRIDSFARNAEPLDDLRDDLLLGARDAGDDALAGQTFLVPDPAERALRRALDRRI